MLHAEVSCGSYPVHRHPHHALEIVGQYQASTRTMPVVKTRCCTSRGVEIRTVLHLYLRGLRTTQGHRQMQRSVIPIPCVDFRTMFDQ